MSESSTVPAVHHSLPVHEVVLLLETDSHRGLSAAEADARLTRFGPNTLPAPHRRGMLLTVLRQFHHPLIYVLLIASVITALLHEFVDSAVIFGVVMINAIVGLVQESKAEAALRGLQAMVHTEARVVRDGHERRASSDCLVPGDVIVVEAGDKIPADIRILRQTELQVDESALTGESLPVSKGALALPESTPVADRLNMAYSGTLVTAGSGVGVGARWTGSGTGCGGGPDRQVPRGAVGK